MRSFLLWQQIEDDNAASPQRVAGRLQEIFGPLFETPPEIRVRSSDHANLAWFELPVEGWKPSFVEQDEGRWVLAIDYPVNARQVLKRHGVPCADGDVLLELSRSLHRDPQSLLKDLAPPFALIVHDLKTGEFSFLNDAMGQSQTFCHRRESTVALTNRLSALSTLGVSLQPVAEEWATRFTTGWFTSDTTGFRDTRFVEGGIRMQFRKGSVEKKRTDVIGDWVHPPSMSRDECHELARQSIVDMSRAAMEQWEVPTLGLSGGWDSRALTAVLRTLGADFSARVRGSPGRLDVILSNRLAEIAGFNLRIKTHSGRPPETAEGCRTSIARALVWQAGGIPTRKHKTFLSKTGHLMPGVVNVTGQHGGFGKADFSVKINATDLDPSEYEPRLIETLMKDAPVYIRPEHCDAVRESIKTAYRQADRYDLEGLDRLHYFFLQEYTRRWGSAAVAAQTGLPFAPFLSPGFIRAAYAYPPELLGTKPFHRFITETLAPDWKGVPYTDQVTDEEVAAGKYPPVDVRHKGKDDKNGDARWITQTPHRKYHYKFYWKDVAFPLIEQARESEGLCKRLFTVNGEFREWKTADALVISHLVSEVLEGAA